MRYLAFDPSMTTGIAFWDGVSPMPELTRTTMVGWHSSAGEMIERGRCFYGRLFQERQPDLVGIEGGIFAGHSDGLTMARQAQTVGLIDWCCWVKKVPVHYIDQGTWRKSFIGFGRAKKDKRTGAQLHDMKTMAKRRCEWLGWDYHRDDNEADAAGVLDNLVSKVAGVIPPWRADTFLPLTEIFQ